MTAEMALKQMCDWYENRTQPTDEAMKIAMLVLSLYVFMQDKEFRVSQEVAEIIRSKAPVKGFEIIKARD